MYRLYSLIYSVRADNYRVYPDERNQTTGNKAE
jgi:hypothetical protein